ncbi:hypothetical protein GCM10011491_45900 [Brucella endophytica]|uniref:Uncharacterized protein n=1 Tax=Brucella endophytica TaxID=1963359 RepID=A0A916SRQ4_9HYPH|nr:hypothetical protein [Brucella endophytica]GGB12958.1 hypothetical protein GCM10011491_45900 [Brucella endophytica]
MSLENNTHQQKDDSIPLQFNVTSQAMIVASDLPQFHPCNYVRVYGKPGAWIQAWVMSQDIQFDHQGSSDWTKIEPVQYQLQSQQGGLQGGFVDFTLRGRDSRAKGSILTAGELYIQYMNSASGSNPQPQSVLFSDAWLDVPGNYNDLLAYNVVSNAPADGNQQCFIYVMINKTMLSQITIVRAHILDGSAKLVNGQTGNSTTDTYGIADDGSAGIATIPLTDTVSEQVSVRIELPESTTGSGITIGPVGGTPGPVFQAFPVNTP